MSGEGKTLKDVCGDVKFENIQFSYPSREEVQVLQNFNLDVKHGTTVALVGESGCGKSTIVKLLQRFYDPSDGHVRLDGTCLRDLNLKWFRSKIGVVSQEPVLFEMSIAENIKLGTPEEGVTMQQVEDAAKKANAHDFIMGLPQKYDTYVGEGGAQLSGGQKQRIAIARALVRDPKILLFDEATSALDTESEGIVQAALDKASEGRTTIIIAHRLSTVRNADVIVFVKDGKVVETGSHNELMEKAGFYYQLVVLQTVVEEEEINEEDEEDDDPDKVQMKLMRAVSTLSADSASSNSYMHLETLATEVIRRRSIRRQKSAVESIGKQEKKNEKDEEEKEDDIEPAPYMRIVKYSTPEWYYLLIGAFFAAIIGAFPILFSTVLSGLLGSFAKKGTEIKAEAKKFAIYFFAMGVVMGVAAFLSEVLFGKAAEKLTRRMRTITFQSLVRKDINFFDDPKNSTGKICAILSGDASNVNAATGAQFQTISKIIVISLTALIVGFVYSWKLTLTILAFAPLIALAGAWQMKVFGNQAVEEGKRLNAANALANQLVSNIRTVASLGKEEYFVEKFNALIKEPYKKAVRNSWLFGASSGVSGAVPMCAASGIFVLGGKLVQDGELTYQRMIMVYMAMMFGSMIAGQMAAMTPDFMKGKVSAARIFRILDYIPTIDSFSQHGITKVAKNVIGNINFSDIDFHYTSRPGVTVLKDFTLDIKAGQKVALVGASGCGKSTTISLLERFYDPRAGNISLDGTSIVDFNIRWWRSQLGLVSQEPVLFGRSIRDNITYGMVEKPTETDIHNAAKNSNIHSFIISLPQGYDTLVGEKGSLISGGQKQRIAIARALIRNPKVMLLDEATSALDSESERVVQEALDASMVGRTSIIIAHRLSTIQNADVIVVMQTGGTVAEIGTHNELVAKQGVYYQLNKTHVT